MSLYKSNYSRYRLYKKPKAIGNRKSSAYVRREYEFDDFLSDVGNTEICRLFGNRDVRAKLDIGDPHDSAEREADRIADAVVNAGNASATNGRVAESSSPQSTHTGSGKQLPRTLRDYLQPRFGVDLGNVRVHTDERANRLSEAIHARAFTLGNDIAFAKGEYAPDTTEGKKLIAHEIAHVIQGDGRTVRRKEQGWLLRRNGTIALNDKKGLVVEYKDAEGKSKTELRKLADPSSLSKSVMKHIGGRNVAIIELIILYGYVKKELDAMNDADLAYLLMTCHGAEWDGRQYVKAKNMEHRNPVNRLLAAYEKDEPLEKLLYFRASSETLAIVAELKKKSKQEYEALKLKEKLEREAYIPEKFFRNYPEAKLIFDEHDMGNKAISDEAHLNFMKQYKILYDNLEKYKPIKTGEDTYATTCNRYYGDYLRKKGYGRVLKAIEDQKFSQELRDENSPEYDLDLYARRNNPVHKAIEYEKAHPDEIETFTDPKKALDLANKGKDVGVLGWFFTKDDSKQTIPLTHYSIVSPSGIVLNENTKRPYKLHNILKFPEKDVIGEPYGGISKDLLLAQSGARLGFVNYLWAYTGRDPYIRYDENEYYYGIIFILLKK